MAATDCGFGMWMDTEECACVDYQIIDFNPSWSYMEVMMNYMFVPAASADFEVTELWQKKPAEPVASQIEMHKIHELGGASTGYCLKFEGETAKGLPKLRADLFDCTLQVKSGARTWYVKIVAECHHYGDCDGHNEIWDSGTCTCRPVTSDDFIVLDFQHDNSERFMAVHAGQSFTAT